MANSFRPKEEPEGHVLEGMPTLYDIDQVSTYLGLAPDTVYRKIRSGQLGAVKTGKNLMVPKSALQKYMSERFNVSAATES